MAQIQHDIKDIWWDGAKGIFYGVSEDGIKFEVGGIVARGWKKFSPQ